MSNKQKAVIKFENKKNFQYRQSENQTGFTLIELLVVIAIIGALVSVIGIALNSARIKARDAKRAGDMRQMITALEQYYIQHGIYPTGTASASASGGLLSDPLSMDASLEPFIPNYVPLMPESPAPPDGSCGNNQGRGNNNYWYDSSMDGLTYTLTFCLGKNTSSWQAGTRIALPNGVQ